MSARTYPEILAELRETCDDGRADIGRPEYVSLRSWHTWGHCAEGAPDTKNPRCECGAELKNGSRPWHCGGCHETYIGEDTFTRHRRGVGIARHCTDPQNAGRDEHWRREEDGWHYGPRREFCGRPGATPPSVTAVAA